MTYSTESLNLFGRMSSQPSYEWKQAYNAFLTTSGMTAVVAKLSGLYLNGGPDEQVSLLNLASNSTATKFGSLTHTPKVGYNSAGSGAYLNSGITANSLSQNNASCFAYITSALDINQLATVGNAGGTDSFRITSSTLVSGSNNVASRINTTTSATYVIGSNITGFFLAQRSVSTQQEIYTNAVLRSTSLQSSATATSSSITLFRNGTNYTPSGTTISMWGFGQALTAGEQLILKNAYEQFATSVSTISIYPKFYMGSSQITGAFMNTNSVKIKLG
jgi:hypothetical protein